MTDPPASVPVRPSRAEPIAITLADLVALVVGAAIAMAPGGRGELTSLQIPGGELTPRWYVGLRYFVEELDKGCLALVPVILARRVRYGGPIRPAEFLVLCVGVPRLLTSLERLPAFGLFGLAQGGGYYPINDEVYRHWLLARFAVSCLAAVIVATRLRTLPAWAKGALVLVVWLGLSGPTAYFYRFGLNRIPESMKLRGPAYLALNLLFSRLPITLLELLPMAAAAVDFLRPVRTGRTWVEWAGLGLAVTPWITTQIELSTRLIFLLVTRPWFSSTDPLHVALPFIAVLLSIMLARRFEPTWRRWLGTDDHPQPNRAAATPGDGHQAAAGEAGR